MNSDIRRSSNQSDIIIKSHEKLGEDIEEQDEVEEESYALVVLAFQGEESESYNVGDGYERRYVDQVHYCVP